MQFQPIQASFPTERGAFQDLIYQHSWGKLGLVQSREGERDSSPTRAAPCWSSPRTSSTCTIQIGDSAWFAEIYDEPYFNLKVDGTGRQAGFQLNKSYVGVGYSLSPKAYTTFGYELSTYDVSGTLFTAHIFKFGLIVHLN